jgi:energy-coupling factor transporter ATP-binding protein EcfA2
MAPIRRIELEQFRGVPGKLSIELLGSDSAACSLLLIGDNGSGKSTIVDALEFALQGRIGREGTLSARGVPSVLSLKDATTAAVVITFSDGTKVMRQVKLDEDGVLEYDQRPHKDYALSPLVLRRADILQFWRTPDEQRQFLFFEYFRAEPGGVVELALPAAIKELQEALYSTKQERRVALSRLAALLGPNATDALSEEIDLEKWITRFVYNGIDSDTREKLKKKGTPAHIPVVQHKLVWKIRELTQRLSNLKKEVKEKTKAAKAAVPTPKAAATQKGLTQISDFVTEAFASLSSAAPFVKSLSLELGKLSSVSLSIMVRTKNDKATSPQKAFSEANLDLLAVLLYVAIARQAAAKGQGRLLVLDDVLQSVDGVTRLRMVEFIVKSLDGWQFVFTLHDRLWAEQLRSVLRRLNHPFVEREIRRWTFDGGPEIVDSLRLPTGGIESAIGTGEVYQICAEAGLLLERCCSHLSHTLPISVTRRRDDRYTLGDLWPGILKALRKNSAKAAAEEVERWMHLRNLLGAHFNEWANTLTRSEAEAFGVAVRDLALLLWCAKCGAWVEAVRVGANKITGWSCRCGKTTVTQDTYTGSPSH